MQDKRLKPNFSGNLGQGQSLSLPFDQSASPLVASLLVVCRPSAVARFIVPVGVNAVERTTDRSRSHVGYKGLEGISPLVAHLNAARAIQFVSVAFGIVASLFGVLPSHVFRRGAASFSPANSTCRSMLKAPRRNHFVSKASAASASSSNDAFLGASQHSPTLTAHRNTRVLSPNFSGVVDHRPAVKNLSNHLFCIAESRRWSKRTWKTFGTIEA